MPSWEMFEHHCRKNRGYREQVLPSSVRARVCVEQASTFGWEMRVPESKDAGLELVGARPCFYAKGKAAHLMYRHHGQPLSVFHWLTDRCRSESVEPGMT